MSDASTVVPDPTHVPASWETWADAASAAHEPALARRLRAEAPTSNPVAEARDLVLLGRGEDALAVLDGVEIAPPAPEQISWDHLILTGALALAGERAAYDWLMTRGRASVREGAPPQVGMFIATVADWLGEVATADELWGQMVADTEFPSPDVLVRCCVGLVRGRDRSSSASVLQSFTWAALALTGHTVPMHVDPRPAMRAASELEAHGDSVGAALLLRTARVFGPRSAPVDEMHEHHVHRLRWRDRTAIAIALLVGAVGWLLAATPGLLVPGVLVMLAAPYVPAWLPIPGFTRPESSWWRTVGDRGRRHHDGTSIRTLTARRPVIIALSWITGVAVGWLVGRTVSWWAMNAEPESLAWFAGPPMIATLIAVVLLTAEVTELVLVRTLVAPGPRREFAEAGEAHRARLQELSESQCSAIVWDSGPTARGRVEHHLEHRPDSPGQLEVERALGSGARVLQCPATLHVWLYGPLGAGGRTLVLRSAPPEPDGATT